MNNIIEYVIDHELLNSFPKDLILKYEFIPLEMNSNTLSVGVYKDENLNLITEFSKIYLQSYPSFIFFKEDEIKSQITKLFREKQDKLSTISTGEDQSKELLKEIIEQAVSEKATDIHFEPQKDMVRVRFRINGDLELKPKIDFKLYQSLTIRVKILGKLNISETRIPQDGRTIISIDKREIDLRISTMPLINGEKIVIRILDKNNFDFKLSSLGFSRAEYALIQQILKEPHGIILVTGPAGSGKTTTLYTMLEYLNRPSRNIISLEDPIEYKIPGINQSQINKIIGYDFETALKSILRQDPNIILIGEIRTSNLADLAFRAGITGHLIFSTLHTNDGPSTILRLLSLGVNQNIISSSLIAILSQRLIKKLCPKCKKSYTSTDHENRILGVKKSIKLFKPNLGGCKLCHNGYSGRLPIIEILTLNNDFRNIIESKPNYINLKNQMQTSNMPNLRDKAVNKIISGEIYINDGLKTVSNI